MQLTVPSTISASSKRLRVLLGTLVAVEATSSSTSAATVAVDAALATLAEIDRRLHPYSSDSDLARINAAAPGTPVTVHPSTCHLLEFAHRLNGLTDGVFDPCVPTREGKLQDVEISSCEVVCRAPVVLDFGGFAKGYAVDCATEVLLTHGCSSGLVNAGGDLRVFGPHSEPILVRAPTGDLSQIALSDSALAVSDALSDHRPTEHQGYYVRSGAAQACALGSAATSDLFIQRYAAVVAKRAVVADALAKCVLLCTEETATRVLLAFDAKQLMAQ